MLLMLVGYLVEGVKVKPKSKEDWHEIKIVGVPDGGVRRRDYVIKVAKGARKKKVGNKRVILRDAEKAVKKIAKLNMTSQGRGGAGRVRIHVRFKKNLPLFPWQEQDIKKTMELEKVKEFVGKIELALNKQFERYKQQSTSSSSAIAAANVHNTSSDETGSIEFPFGHVFKVFANRVLFVLAYKMAIVELLTKSLYSKHTMGTAKVFTTNGDFYILVQCGFDKHAREKEPYASKGFNTKEKVASEEA